MLNDFEISLSVADGPDGSEGESPQLDRISTSSVMIKRIPNLSSKEPFLTFPTAIFFFFFLFFK